MKRGVPAFTVSQPDEAMHVLEETASSLDVSAKVNHYYGQFNPLNKRVY